MEQADQSGKKWQEVWKDLASFKVEKLIDSYDGLEIFISECAPGYEPVIRALRHIFHYTLPGPFLVIRAQHSM